MPGGRARSKKGSLEDLVRVLILILRSDSADERMDLTHRFTPLADEIPAEELDPRVLRLLDDLGSDFEYYSPQDVDEYEEAYGDEKLEQLVKDALARLKELGVVVPDVPL